MICVRSFASFFSGSSCPSTVDDHIQVFPQKSGRFGDRKCFVVVVVGIGRHVGSISAVVIVSIQSPSRRIATSNTGSHQPVADVITTSGRVGSDGSSGGSSSRRRRNITTTAASIFGLLSDFFFAISLTTVHRPGAHQSKLLFTFVSIRLLFAGIDAEFF